MQTGERLPDGDRRAELLGAAATGDLDAGERSELDRLLRGDPSAGAELQELRATAALLATYAGAEPPRADLRGRVLQSLGSDGDRQRPATPGPVHAPAGPVPPRTRWLAAAAAAVVLLGGGVLLGRAGADPTVAAALTGPPGTLGAREALAIETAPGVAGDAAVVAHTWGTEALLQVGGLPAGQTYRVAFVAGDGTEVDAGSFLATTGRVTCRLNAALLRQDAQGLTVRAPDGSSVLAASLPAVLSS